MAFKGTFLLVVMVLAAIGVGVAVEPVHSYQQTFKGPFGSFGSFAGYRWSGTPESISAEWQVPFVIRSPIPSYASTWIGAQGPGNPFIQLGTLENFPNLGGEDDHFFWSDSALGFEPKTLSAVHVSDHVTVSMTVTPQGWRLAFQDLDARTKTVINTSVSTSGFNLGEWLQEDPGGRAPVPYPVLQSTRFTKVLVNGMVPRLTVDDALWMSVPHLLIAPSTFLDDQFQVRPIELNRFQRQFLADGRPFKTVSETLACQAAHWSGHSSAGAAEHELIGYLTAAAGFVAALPTQLWPTNALSSINALLPAFANYLHALRALAAGEPSPPYSITSRATDTAEKLERAISRALTALGIPATNLAAQCATNS